MVSSEILSRGRAADSGGCLILLVEVGMVTDRFRKILQPQCRNLTVGSPPLALVMVASTRSAPIDRPKTVLRIRIELRYRLYFRKGRLP